MQDVLRELIEHPPEKPGDSARAEIRANLTLLRQAFAARLSARTIAAALTQRTGRKWTAEKLRRCIKEVAPGQQVLRTRKSGK